jgi:hypothetical protein
MPAIDHVAQRLHPAFGPGLEPDRAHAFAVDGGDLFARAQVGDGAAAVLDRHAVGDAAAGAALVEAEHQTRPLGRAAVNEGIDAERPMRADEPRFEALDERKVGPPHQRTIGEHPEIFVGMRGIRVHVL